MEKKKLPDFAMSEAIDQAHSKVAKKVKQKADSDGNCAACDYFSDEHVACAAPDDVECDAKPEADE